jgi:hypothetical protein
LSWSVTFGGSSLHGVHAHQRVVHRGEAIHEPLLRLRVERLVLDARHEAPEHVDVCLVVLERLRCDRGLLELLLELGHDLVRIVRHPVAVEVGACPAGSSA